MSILGDSIKELREKNKLTLKELADKSGVGQSTISDIETGKAKNPKAETLSKLASVFNISVDELLFKKWDDKYKNLKEWDSSLDKITTQEEKIKYLESIVDFADPKDAVKFLLKQPSIMGFGGFDISKMTDEEIIEFANELLKQLKLVSYKFKK